jgi:CheY-like chemotaxis protein
MAEPVLETILLVEDTPSDATLIRRGFEKTNVLNPIVWTKNGQEALGYLSGLGQYGDRIKYPLPALVLLDLDLPEMTGFELLQWKRSQPNIRRIPFVVLTMIVQPALSTPLMIWEPILTLSSPEIRKRLCRS